MIDIHSITGDLETKTKLYGRPADIKRMWSFREVVCFESFYRHPIHDVIYVSFPPHLVTETIKGRIEDLGGQSVEHSIGEGFSVMDMIIYYVPNNAGCERTAIMEKSELFVNTVLGGQ